MSTSDPIPEVSLTAGAWRALLKSAYQEGGVKYPRIIKNLGIFPDGTRYLVENGVRAISFYLVTDLPSKMQFDMSSGQSATLSALEVLVYGLDSGTGIPKAIRSASIAGNDTLFTQARGNLQTLQQRAVTFELLVQLASAGVQLDPRQFRNSLGVVSEDVFNNLLVSPVGTLGAGFLQDANGALGAAQPINSLVKALTPTANHLTTNGTTNLTAADAWISSVVITTDVGGTGSSVTVQDKAATPKKLVNAAVTTAVSTTPTVLSLPQPALMNSGIDIVTAGAVAATIDIWVDYWQ